MEYGKAQRQLDTHTHTAGWILSGEDYIMHSISEWVPVTFMPTSGKLSGLCTSEHYIILYELLNEYFNINSIWRWDSKGVQDPKAYATARHKHNQNLFCY